VPPEYPTGNFTGIKAKPRMNQLKYFFLKKKKKKKEKNKPLFVHRLD
jgi:hypothetical protein